LGEWNKSFTHDGVVEVHERNIYVLIVESKSREEKNIMLILPIVVLGLMTMYAYVINVERNDKKCVKN